MNCLGAKYLTRELAENTARMLLRSSPAARQAIDCAACGYFHLIRQEGASPRVAGGALEERKIA